MGEILFGHTTDEDLGVIYAAAQQWLEAHPDDGPKLDDALSRMSAYLNGLVDFEGNVIEDD